MHRANIYWASTLPQALIWVLGDLSVNRTLEDPDMLKQHWGLSGRMEELWWEPWKAKKSRLTMSVEYLTKDVGFWPLECSESLKMIHITGQWHDEMGILWIWMYQQHAGPYNILDVEKDRSLEAVDELEVNHIYWEQEMKERERKMSLVIYLRW